MPTSGTTTWEMDRDLLVRAALRKCGAISEGQTPSTEDFANGTEALNGIMAAFQTLGMPLWERREFNIPLTNNVSQYNIGVGQTIDTPFPLKLYSAYLVTTATGQQTEMEIKSEYDWQEVRSGTASAYPVFVTYTPRINFGVLSVWPIPNTQAASLYSIKLVGQAPFEDITSSTHTLDFPKEWHNAIVYELACALSPEYGVSAQEKADLERAAKKWLDMAKDFGTDESSIFIQPQRRR